MQQLHDQKLLESSNKNQYVESAIIEETIIQVIFRETAVTFSFIAQLSRTEEVN